MEEDRRKGIMKLRIKSSRGKEAILQDLYTKLEIPFINIFGNGLYFTIVLREQDGNMLLRSNMKSKLDKLGFDTTIPPEIRAQRSVFVRCVHETVGSHTNEELKMEIEKQQNWIQIINVIKIKDYTHVFKLECATTEMAEKIRNTRLLIYETFIPGYRIEKDNFVSVQTCFTCYKYEHHASPNCPQKGQILCSECASTEHRWTECRFNVKKMLKLQGATSYLGDVVPSEERIYVKQTISNTGKDHENKTETI